MGDEIHPARVLKQFMARLCRAMNCLKRVLDESITHAMVMGNFISPVHDLMLYFGTKITTFMGLNCFPGRSLAEFYVEDQLIQCSNRDVALVT